MKKGVIVLLILFLIPTLSLKAVAPSLYYGITVRPGPMESLNYDEETERYTLDGHFDLLIKSSDYKANQISSEISTLYQTLFPFYESVDYLNDTEWISYLAYMKEASFTLEEEYTQEPLYVFAHISSQYETIKNVKVIYFNDQGETMFVTNAVSLKMANPFEWQSGDSHIYVDMETQTLTSYFDAHLNPFLLFFGFLILLASVILTALKAVVATLMGITYQQIKSFIWASFLSYILFSSWIVYIWSGGNTIIDLRDLLLTTSFIFVLFAIHVTLESGILFLIYRKNGVIRKLIIRNVIIYDILLVILWLVV